MYDLWILLSTAFILGFMGSGHCLGMCGGIVLTVNSLSDGKTEVANPLRRNILEQLLFNSGRIFSYSLAGAVLGALMGGAALALDAMTAPRIAAGFMTIIVGISITGWWKGLQVLEQMGAVIWRRLQKMTRFFVPATTPFQWFGLGMLWGWLPCGLVYSALIYAVTSGSAIRGFLVMLAFGFGTLPALLAAGSLSTLVIQSLRGPELRVALGLGVVVLGCLMLWMSLGMHAHHGQHPLPAESGRPIMHHDGRHLLPEHALPE